MKEVYIIERVESKKDPAPIFATYNEVFAIEEMEKLNNARTPDKLCFYRVTPVLMKEIE